MDTLVIRQLKEVAAIPNGFDPRILAHIQENLAVDVMRQHMGAFTRLVGEQKERGIPEAEAERQRSTFFATMLQSEYENRARNGNGFSLPLYVEAATNYYRMEMGRHLQVVKDYLTMGHVVAARDLQSNVRDVRRADADINALAHRVADGINGIEESLANLSRVKSQAAKAVAATLHTDMTSALAQQVSGDPFAQALLKEAAVLAGARRGLANMAHDELKHEAALRA